MMAFLFFAAAGAYIRIGFGMAFRVLTAFAALADPAVRRLDFGLAFHILATIARYLQIRHVQPQLLMELHALLKAASNILEKFRTHMKGISIFECRPDRYQKTPAKRALAQTIFSIGSAARPAIAGDRKQQKLFTPIFIEYLYFCYSTYYNCIVICPQQNRSMQWILNENCVSAC